MAKATTNQAATIAPPELRRLTLTVFGTTPLVVHRMSEKVKKELRDRKLKTAKKLREPLNATKEFEDAMYRLEDGRHGIRADGVKKAIYSAAHKDLGLPATVVKKHIFVEPDEPATNLLALQVEEEPTMREDVVTVGNQQRDLRYRPQYENWRVQLRIQYDSEQLNAHDLLNLVQRSGFSIGFCEHRPEKGGDWGRFQVDTEAEVKDEPIQWADAFAGVKIDKVA